MMSVLASLFQDRILRSRVRERCVVRGVSGANTGRRGWPRALRPLNRVAIDERIGFAVVFIAEELAVDIAL
jgi:hypothetical protein